MADQPALPAYTDPALKRALIGAGASGTIYALVMPETEAALQFIVGDAPPAGDDAQQGEALSRRTAWLDLYREPWTQKQDEMHGVYFATWLEWAAPVVQFDPGNFPHRYPTAGASEGIYKLMAEYLARCHSFGQAPSIHVFDGEYEGFAAYAAALSIPLVRHVRERWQDVPEQIAPGAQFWISQPSAIDGNVWPWFEQFLARMAQMAPTAEVIPDLTYVGCVARPFAVSLDMPNVPAFVISQSKPFGGYYQRAGAVLARREVPSLFGNRWFKNLLSLSWASEMMRRHGVHDLPARYRPLQEQATRHVAVALEVAGLQPADVMVLATAPVPAAPTPVLASVLRGAGSERVVRLCLTPAMSIMIDPVLACATLASHSGLAGLIATGSTKA